MIPLLALAAAAAPQAGTTFVCGQISVATAEDIAAPAGGDGRLFLVSHVGDGTELEQIVDLLPASLIVTWRRENNSPVRLEIGEIDRGAGTASYTLRAELDPASRLFTPVETRGFCTLRAGATVGQDFSR